MKVIPLRTQLGVVALGYAGVLLFSATMVYQRYLDELRDPQSAFGGMYAAGDTLMGVFIFLLLMIPSGFLLWIMRSFERAYTKYSKVLLAFSITAPVCLGLLCLGQLLHANVLTSDRSALNGGLVARVFLAPLVLVLIVTSRLFARFDRPKSLVQRALLLEGGTLAILVTLLIFSQP